MKFCESCDGKDHDDDHEASFLLSALVAAHNEEKVIKKVMLLDIYYKLQVVKGNKTFLKTLS